jgi:hypothetical protein
MSEFTMRLTWPYEKPHDYVFRYSGKNVGRCYLRRTPRGDTWHWTIYGSGAVGDAASLDLAKEEFKAEFKKHRGL